MIVTVSMLKQKYAYYTNPLDKIRRDADQGVIFRLNRGLYETDRNVDPYLLAAPILSPSYLSFEFALSYYGLIPERTMAITSATLNVRKNKTYVNVFGRYEYSDIPASAFSEGLCLIGEGEYIVRMASKEKAICDSLYKWRVVHSIKALKELLFIDKRMDEDEFASCDFIQMKRLAKLYRRNNLKLLIRLIEKEYSAQ
jgi:predicted transcriptional regulator of viral defense system